MIAILDFGSQYSQIIARRVRELHVYSEIFAWNAPPEAVLAGQPKGFILSGGPLSVYEPGAPQVPAYVLQSGLPVLGICYGMQALSFALGGAVAASQQREYGLAEVETLVANPLLPAGKQTVWMSHGDRIEELPVGFVALARSTNSPIAAMGNLAERRFGLQFHPEVVHTPGGREILGRFVIDVCGESPTWTAEAMIEQAVERIRQQTNGEPVLSAVSGGVDSSVATALVHRAVGERLSAVFIDTGLLRQGERQQVEEAFRANLGSHLVVVDGRERFLQALKSVTDPESKRKIIGETFIRTFEDEAKRLGQPRFLVQGTIYPDVVESSAPGQGQARTIKSHHNVGGLPSDLSFNLVEPLRNLFKDEVRAVGEALGLPAALVWRQPFPGPGLAVRCLGEITAERLAKLRAADAIFTRALTEVGLLNQAGHNRQGVAQAFAVLLPVRTVGVMGDQRTYDEVIALRAVQSDDFMTANCAKLDFDMLLRVANQIVNEVAGVNRVVYDITSKPPATIEWE